MTQKAPLVARILLGLIFFVFGLNGFLQFLPMPKPADPAYQFFGAMMATGYFLPVLKATEVVCGALLLAGVYVPLALVILSPIVIQIVLFHAFLDPSGMGMNVLLVALMAYLGFAYRKSFAGILAAKTSL
ncbi:MAG: DoxX family membrane protein [Oligoflexia bacterium]|nr:DoxX family membrane protein [Oligoflexia bacterium]